MRISTSMMYQNGLTGILDQQAEISKTQAQMSSGEKLQNVSDDPVAATKILMIDEQLGNLEQYSRNGESAENMLDYEDTLLGEASDTLQRIRELTVQALNDTLSDSDRQDIAAEVEQHLESLLDFANARDANGQYLFSGYQTETEPFTETSAGVFEYNGDQGQRTVKISDSSSVFVADPGVDVFMGIETEAGGSASVFEIVYALASDLASGTVNSSSLTDIDSSLEKILDTRATVGGRLNGLEARQEANESVVYLLKEARSVLADVDYNEAVTRFSQQTTALEAAQAAFVKMQNLSLFNYIS